MYQALNAHVRGKQNIVCGKNLGNAFPPMFRIPVASHPNTLLLYVYTFVTVRDARL